MDWRTRAEFLEEENGRLLARIDVLERALAECEPLPLEWGLTPSEAAVFGVLVNRSMATKESVSAALYRDLGRDEPDPKIVDVFICKIRKKVAPYGIDIHTVWGQGYRLDQSARDRFAKQAA